jgi:hypothetical protein
MEVIFEIIFYVLGELLLSVIGETLFELGFHSLAEAPSNRISKRVFFGFLYAVAGIVLGALSLKVIPLLVFGGPAVGVAYLIVAPLLAGLALCGVNWIMNRGIDERAGFFQLKKFVYGVLFAFMFSLTRATFG